MPLIYKNLAVNKADGDAPDKRTHTLTFREAATESPDGMMSAGMYNTALTLQLTENEAQAYTLGAAYDLTLSPVKE